MHHCPIHGIGESREPGSSAPLARAREVVSGYQSEHPNGLCTIVLRRGQQINGAESARGDRMAFGILTPGVVALEFFLRNGMNSTHQPFTTCRR